MRTMINGMAFSIMNYEAFFVILYTYAKMSGSVKCRGFKLALHNAIFGTLTYQNPNSWIFGKGLNEEGYLSAMANGTKDTPRDILDFAMGSTAGFYRGNSYSLPSPETFQILLDTYFNSSTLSLFIRKLKEVIRNDQRLDDEEKYKLEAVLLNEGAATFVYECFMFAIKSPNTHNAKPRKSKSECARAQERSKNRMASMSPSERILYMLEINFYEEDFEEDSDNSKDKPR